MKTQSFRFACVCGHTKTWVEASSYDAAREHIYGHRSWLPICDTCHGMPYVYDSGAQSEPDLAFKVNADVSSLTTAAAQMGEALQKVGMSTDEMAAAIQSSYGAAIPVVPKLVNFPPPADAKEWTCLHGNDGLWCHSCTRERETVQWARLQRQAAQAEPVAAPLPKRRAMVLTGEVPA